MATRHITTTHPQDVCDICGRTLLRGEQPEAFLDGHRRYSVCELCKQHALHEGWVREGTIPEYQGGSGGTPRRRSLLGRLRPRAADGGDEGSEGTATGRRDGRLRRNGRPLLDDEEPQGPQTLDDELSIGEWPPPERVGGPLGDESQGSSNEQLAGSDEPPEAPDQDIAADRYATPAPAPARRGRSREPRRVHAVPSGEQQKIAAALKAFNRTEYTRTVGSVSRSLGVPGVNVTPDPEYSSIVRIVATWELCWYRYEIDLGDDPGSVRLDGQGYELGELAEHELVTNAVADEAGRLYYE